jgi:hypothetical protein
MFVLAVKRNSASGKTEKYKARLVGFANKQDETSYVMIKSSTARGSSVKLLNALQAQTYAHSMVLDVKGTFFRERFKIISKPNGICVYLMVKLFMV